MKFSENWLRTVVNPALSSNQLSQLLTMAGLEVEAAERAAPAFDQVVVAKVLTAAPHPNADRLRVCQVDAGGPVRSIVCGAPNVAAGVTVACAEIGALLPGGEIQQTTIRGVVSEGMLCSAKELGLSDDSSGLILLPDTLAAGTRLRDALDLDDTIFTLKLTPNRGDCLSIIGVAREVSALTGSALHLVTVGEIPETSLRTVPVIVLDADSCPLYCGRVIEAVNVAANTPDWIVRRLERGGVRSLSAVVDITNYVMLETGQPLHAFDLDALQGPIRVRFARTGEKLVLLNGQSIELTRDLLTINDDSGAIALAGIMGGVATAVSKTTRSVFLESAFFTPQSISGRPRRLGFSSDAAHRFERGVDFGATRKALDRACELMLEVCGGNAGKISIAAAVLPIRNAVTLRVDRARRVLGIPLTDAEVGEVFSRLGFSFESTPGVFQVRVPSHRFDISIEEDLIEEIARIRGYEQLLDSMPRGTRHMLAVPETVLPQRAMKNALVGRDYQEIVSYSFVDASWESDFARNSDPIFLANPIATHMSVMRSNLIGSLIECLRFNLNRKQTRVRIFELSRCFVKDVSGLRQPLRLGGLAFGPAAAEQWGVASRQVDFFDVKGDVESLLGISSTVFERSDHPALHPGRSALVKRNGQIIGFVGELHPQWCQKYELPSAPVVFEVTVAGPFERSLPRHQEISKFPIVRRDGAFVLPDEVSVGLVLDTLRARKPAIVVDISVFDLYRGPGVEDGKKSLAFRWLLQDTQKTLTDAEVDVAGAILREILEKEFGGKLRQ